MVAALEGLVVADAGKRLAVSYCTKLLGDLGAAVVRVGRAREGRLFRRFLDVGKAPVERVPERADIVVTDRADASGPLGTTTLVRITDFGGDGPYQGRPVTPLVLQALAGWVNSRGVPGTPPVQAGGQLDEYTAASFAACAALTALRAARDLGEPVIVDVSVFECLVGTLPYPMLFHQTLQGLGLPPPDRSHATLPGIVRAKDGWVGINALTGQHFQDICAMCGLEEFANRQTELRWGGPELDRFYAKLQPWLDERTVAEIVELCQAFRIPAAPVGDGCMMLECAQFRERPFFVDLGGLRVPGPPYRLSRTPARVAGSASPTEAGEPRSAPTPSREVGRVPFEGLRVLDLGTFWAAPYFTMYLGAFGADVVKIESVQRPDGFRFSGAFPQEGDDWYERSGIWQGTNLNKRGVTLDLGREEGRALLARLIGGADVVVENFSPRVVEQFGFDYESVRRLRPDVIMVRMPGFGLKGPWRDYVGWAMSIEQAAGMAFVTGYRPRPMNPGGFLDPVVGMHAAVALQAALRHRDRTGEGQLIELAQLETGCNLTAEQVLLWQEEQRLVEREGNRDRRFVPQGVYPASDGWVALSVRDEKDWTGLAELVGLPTGLSADERWREHDRIDGALTAWLSGMNADGAVTALVERGIPAGRVLTAERMYEDPQLVARGYYQDLRTKVTGVRRYPGWPVRFSAGPANHHRFGAPSLGEHNDEVLGRELGLEASELARLRALRVIGERM